LLALLLGAEPRGLPGTVIDRVAFQRAGEGHPLDDVIVYAHSALGVSAILEIQVKRGATFAPNDPVFHSVIEQIAKVSLKPEFDRSQYELGIAISRTSQKIGGAYQDVLTWARQVGDAKTFIGRVDRVGGGSADKRAFVEAFRTQLVKAGARGDDEAVWKYSGAFRSSISISRLKGRPLRSSRANAPPAPFVPMMRCAQQNSGAP
jgi:hypothetical protein